MSDESTDSGAELMAREAELERHGWPPALIKAASDTFEYSIGLKSGTVIDFESAEFVDEDWVHLVGIDFVSDSENDHPRGIDVRVSEIAWVADTGPKDAP